MKKMLVVALAALCLAGCQSPEQRIKQNPELFASFAPEVQDSVRAGKIDVGYSKDMVYIALGKPNRQYTRKTADGTTEVWSYTKFYTTTERQRVNGDFRIRDSKGIYRTVSDSVWVDVQQQHEYETKRVEFKDAVVTAIEDIQR